MPVAPHSLQITVLNYAYDSFIDTVAGYLEGARDDGLEQFLLYEAYAVFQDRWPHNECSESWVSGISDILDLDLTTIQVH